jgi:hypothetical protein
MTLIWFAVVVLLLVLNLRTGRALAKSRDRLRQHWFALEIAKGNGLRQFEWEDKAQLDKTYGGL